MSGRKAGARAFVLGLTVAVACGRTDASSPGLPSISATAAAAAPAASSATPAVAVDASWPALVRGERWDAAWRALEALPANDRARPELRYVRARVALERGDAGAALPLLVGLESELPLLAEDIGRRRSEAELAVGPFAEAGEWFAARASAAAQLDAARAFERAKDARRARSAVERLLAIGKHTRGQEADARALRVRVADPPGDVERADARWLASFGADLSADAMAVLARVDPKHPLGASELMVRARVLSEAGRVDDALHAIDLAATAPGARAMALFHARGRSSEAAKALGECAAAGGGHAAEDAFHAARALSRADRDEEAIRGYEDVQHRFPKSKWAASASFFVPYLRMLHGEWKECAAGFGAHVRAHPAGEHERDARRDEGLCELLAGDAKSSRVVFERLSEDESADPIASGRMSDMAALAAMRDGDRTHAIAVWTDVATLQPLTWPALVARARLTEAGAPVPSTSVAAADAGESEPALTVVLPPPADLLHEMGLDEDAENALRDRESAVTSSAGGRLTEALCAAYGVLGRARRRYQLAQTIPSVLFQRVPDPRTRWAWDCAFPSPYASEVRAAESKEGLPAGLAWAVMRQESGFDPDAVSPARAIGLMQLLPETARAVADELPAIHDDARLTSPPYAILVGARVLRKLFDRLHGDVPLAVAGYNAGAEAIERWLSRSPGMQLDTFVERIPFDETRDYVVRVMGNLARYGYMAAGEGGIPRLELDLKSK
jgi:soluble lytic murein transglycosylase